MTQAWPLGVCDGEGGVFSHPLGNNGVLHRGEAMEPWLLHFSNMMALAWSHHLFAGQHLISIRTESGSIPQRISRQAHLLCLHTPQTNGKLVSWSLWSRLTTEDSSCCWSLSNRYGGQVLTQSLSELRSPAGIVLYH